MGLFVVRSAFLFYVISGAIAIGISVPEPRSTYRYIRRQDGTVARLKRTYSVSPFTESFLPLHLDEPQVPQRGRLLVGLAVPDSGESPQSQTSSDYYARFGNPNLISENRNKLIPLRKYRKSVLPTPKSSLISTVAANDNDDAAISSSLNQGKSDQETRQLRILGWLFGQPSYSRYPDYSVLESAAGIPPYPSYGSRVPPYAHSGSPYVVEECTELLDPYTHEIIEDCYELPMLH